MNIDLAQELATGIVNDLAPHCEPGRCEIAGSIRRKKPEPGDIEVVCIPKPYQVGLFADGIAPIVNAWPKVKGELPCKYTQRLLPFIDNGEPVKLDLFFATPESWGLILAIRTGSADYSHHVLAEGWKAKGYHGDGGMLFDTFGNVVPVREEIDLFRLIGIPWCAPENRIVAAKPFAELQDDSPMPFGKYKGQSMESIPASYLFWLWTNGKDKDTRCPVADYIRRNKEALAKEYPDGIW